MRALVLGAGMMGSAEAFDLAHSADVEKVFLADRDGERAQAVARRLGSKVEALTIDAGQLDDIVAVMRNVDVALGATSYQHNLLLTQAAITAKIPFFDLGGNMDVVYRQMEMDGLAKSAGVIISPNCGLAPGLACILAAGGAQKFQRVDTIQLRVGGLPKYPKPPLNYQLVFSAEGLVNEYLEPAEVLRNGKIASVPSMEELEEINFPQPFGSMEAFTTSGGISTLPQLFEGKVNELDYKTIRYPGHCDKFKMLLDLGFAGSEPILLGDKTFTAREVFQHLLISKLAHQGPDLVLLRVSLTGMIDGMQKHLEYEMIDYYDENEQISSMMRTTAFPTSIIAQMAVRGEITVRGVVPPEQCVPLDPLLNELRKRDIIIHERVY